MINCVIEKKIGMPSLKTEYIVVSINSETMYSRVPAKEMNNKFSPQSKICIIVCVAHVCSVQKTGITDFLCVILADTGEKWTGKIPTLFLHFEWHTFYEIMVGRWPNRLMIE